MDSWQTAGESIAETAASADQRLRASAALLGRTATDANERLADANTAIAESQRLLSERAEGARSDLDAATSAITGQANRIEDAAGSARNQSQFISPSPDSGFTVK